MRNLPARHRSLRAVFDHSWRLLSAPEQAVLPQLAIFRGGFRLAEVQAVTGASRLLLTGLVDKSRLSVSVEGRFDLHEQLRQYLLEKLREDLALYQATHDDTARSIWRCSNWIGLSSTAKPHCNG